MPRSPIYNKGHIHKIETSPWKAVNQLSEKYEKYTHEITTIIFNEVIKLLGGKLKKAHEDASLIFKGKIMYNPKDGKPIKLKDWNRLEQAISRYLGIEKKFLQKKMTEDSYFLGTLLNRLNEEQRKIKSLKDFNLENPDWNKYGYNNFDKDIMEASEQGVGIYLQNVTDRMRSKIQSIIIEGIKEKKDKNEIFQDLWDSEVDLNRDWDRVIRTETAYASNNGMLISQLRTTEEDYVLMKGISAPTACEYCLRLVNEKVVVLVESAPESGEKIEIEGKEYIAIWPGKSNYGRKARDYWTATIIHPYCYSEDTELLTNEGWKYFYELNGKEKIFSINPNTQEVGYIDYINKIKYEYKGNMINIKGKSLDLLTTPEHNSLCYTNNRSKLVEIKSKDLLIRENVVVPKAVAKWKGLRPKYIKIDNSYLTPEQYVVFMGWYLSEGCLNRDKYISISQNNIMEVIHDLHSVGFPYPILFNFNMRGKRIFIKSPELVKLCKILGYSKDKYIPKVLKLLDREYLKLFLKTFCKGDGSKIIKKSCIKGYNFETIVTCYYTTSKQLESDISELMIKVGKFPTFRTISKKGSKVEIRGKQYITNSDVLSIYETKSRTVKVLANELYYSGNVYDIELSKWHYFLVRRNGKAVWSGNCRCSWTEWTFELEKLFREKE